MSEECVDNHAHVALFGIQEPGDARQVGNANRPNLTAANPGWRRPYYQKVFIIEWNRSEAWFRNGKRNQAKVETPVQQSGNDLFCIGNGNVQVCPRILFPQHAQGPPKAIDQSGDSGGKVKRTGILLWLTIEIGL